MRAPSLSEWAIAAALLLGACAPPPRPPEMVEADAAVTSPASTQASEWAPQAHAEAVRLQVEAEQAWQRGEEGLARLLTERSLAHLEQAVVLARLAQATKQLTETEQVVSKREAELQGLQGQQRELEAEARDLELQAKVERNALPIASVERASPAREQARRRAARSILEQARLLCRAARLLAPDDKELSALEAELAEQGQDLPSTAGAKAIAGTRRQRTQCLGVLARIRRPATRRQPNPGRADALLEALGAREGLHPYRDDRGVVVALSGTVGQAGKFDAPTANGLEFLGRVAGRHTGFPVLLVVHDSAKSDPAHADATAQAASAILESAGSGEVTVERAGRLRPLLPAGTPVADPVNARLEVVFVAPTIN